MNRRAFVSQLSVASLAAALGPSWLRAKEQARVSGANSRIRVGLVGFGDRARGSLVPSFQRLAAEQNCELVACCDLWRRRREEALVHFRQRYNQEIAVYRNSEEMYEQANLDAVIIATADFQHALHCIEAVRAGCDAYVEKPFAETMVDNRAALAAVRATQRIVQIGSQRRSSDNYRAAYDYLRSGRFGDIVAAEMTWHVNQPDRWRRPDLVAAVQEQDVDWQRFQLNRPLAAWDPRKFIEFRLFWPYSSGIPGQWMCHQIDTVHWFTGLPHPRSVTANGGLYLWQDGRTNADTLTAVFDYGPFDNPARGFLVTYSARFTNSAGGVKELYFSNGGELNLLTNKVTANGGLEEEHAKPMGLAPRRIDEAILSTHAGVTTAANTAASSEDVAHMRNWMECLRTRQQPHAPVLAGYQHAIATIMANAAFRTGQRVTFDEATQNVMAGGKIFHL